MLLAHGARDPRWALPFEAIARRLAEAAPAVRTRLCFLEFMAPGIVDAGHALVAEGCGDIDLVPLFLGGGGHVRKDVPLLLAELEAAHPAVRWRLHPPVGERPAVIEALAGAALACIEPTAASAALHPGVERR